MRLNTYLGTTDGEARFDGVVVNVSQYRAGTALPPHRHDRPYFCVVLRGRLVEEHRRGSDVLDHGSVVFHPRREAHADRFSSAGALCLNLAFDASWAGPGSNAGRGVWHRSFASLLGLRLTSLMASQPRDREPAETLLADIWGALHPAVEKGPVPRWLGRVTESIAQDPARATVGSLAREAGVHPGHLARTFRRAHGIALGTYLRRERLSRCCALLASSTDPLALVAGDAGYADQSHMSNVLKRVTGRTPRSLRRFLRGGDAPPAF